MGYFLVLLYSTINLAEGMTIKSYSKKHGSGGMIMNAIISLVAMLFFLLTDKNGFHLPKGILPLAIINSSLYAVGFFLTYVAYQLGSFGITRLISSFGLVIPIFYGLFFLGEKASLLTYFGIILIIGAMVLINSSGKDENKKFSVKWLLAITASTVANGFIAILTKYQQIRFENSASNEFMSISLFGSFLCLALGSILCERKKLNEVIKYGSLFGIIGGLLNGAKNLVTIIVYLFLPISTVSPMTAGLGVVFSFTTSYLFFKERFSLKQIVGAILGAVSVILLTL